MLCPHMFIKTSSGGKRRKNPLTGDTILSFSVRSVTMESRAEMISSELSIQNCASMPRVLDCKETQPPALHQPVAVELLILLHEMQAKAFMHPIAPGRGVPVPSQ